MFVITNSIMFVIYLVKMLVKMLVIFVIKELVNKNQ